VFYSINCHQLLSPDATNNNEANSTDDNAGVQSDDKHKLTTVYRSATVYCNCSKLATTTNKLQFTNGNILIINSQMQTMQQGANTCNLKTSRTTTECCQELLYSLRLKKLHQFSSATTWTDWNQYSQFLTYYILKVLASRFISHLALDCSYIIRERSYLTSSMPIN